MECTSKRSKSCAGVGNEIWGGLCSNCADEKDRTTRKPNSLSSSEDWREGLKGLEAGWYDNEYDVDNN